MSILYKPKCRLVRISLGACIVCLQKGRKLCCIDDGVAELRVGDEPLVLQSNQDSKVQLASAHSSLSSHSSDCCTIFTPVLSSIEAQNNSCQHNAHTHIPTREREHARHATADSKGPWLCLQQLDILLRLQLERPREAAGHIPPT